jgi:hypothetical protein
VQTSEDFGAKSDAWESIPAEGISIESGRERLPCSNVAKTVRQALDALDVGRVDIARTCLVQLLTEATGAHPKDGGRQR